MRFIPRLLAEGLARAARDFPVIVLTGPRRAGKTTLLEHAFPAASRHLLEDPDLVGRVRSDSRGFLEGIRLPAILDEIQNAPEILNYIRALADRGRTRRARWLLTGSQEPALMKGVTESMAGRAALFQLLPLSAAETPRVDTLHGGFPEVLARPSSAGVWFRSYIQTYLERDVRAISSIRSLPLFRRFLALVASRIGQVLNRSEFAVALGVSIPTITEWLHILEATNQVILLPPYFENFGKRLIKSPKIYLADTGLACHLLGIETAGDLARSVFRGPLFENHVAVEVAKTLLNAGRRSEFYWFRDRQGLEVDFLVPVRGDRLVLFEAKASRTIRPEDGRAMRALAKRITNRPVDCFVVHEGARDHAGSAAVTQGVRAATIGSLSEILRTGR